MSEPTRVYKKEGCVVEWRKELCIHCKTCITELPEVFNADARPWVNVEGALADRIREQVGRCPSGALALGGSNDTS